MAGIRFPVFLTRSVYDAFVTVPPNVAGQDEAGSLCGSLPDVAGAVHQLDFEFRELVIVEIHGFLGGGHGGVVVHERHERAVGGGVVQRDDGANAARLTEAGVAILLVELLHDLDAELRITVWAKTWGQIIQDCKGRLNFFKAKLDYEANHDSALSYLKKAHEKYIPTCLDGADTKEADATKADIKMEGDSEPKSAKI